MNDIDLDREPPLAMADRHGSDSHGKAALLLVESLLHALVDRSVLSVPAAIEVVEIAADVELETLDGTSDSIHFPSHSLLTPIAASLRFDLPHAA